MLTVLTEPN